MTRFSRSFFHAFFIVAFYSAHAAVQPAQLLSIAEVDERPVLNKSQRQPVYPYEMRKNGMGGKLLLEFVITKEGLVQNPTVVNETTSGFSTTTLDAVKTWHFAPARKQKAAVDVKVRVWFVYNIGLIFDGDKNVLLTDCSPPDPSANELPAFSVTINLREDLENANKPIPIGSVKAVYPFPLLVAAVTGRVKIRYLVDQRGEVIYTSVQSASKPEFAQAALARIWAQKFEPPKNKGLPWFALGDLTVNFQKESPDVAINDNTWKILAELNNPGKSLVSARDLDFKLALRTTIAPIASHKPSGGPETVVIECIVDQNGDVQLPQIVQAVNQERAYDALTAASQWKFTPPTKGGQAVNCRIRLPFKFQ